MTSQTTGAFRNAASGDQKDQDVLRFFALVLSLAMNPEQFDNNPEGFQKEADETLGDTQSGFMGFIASLFSGLKDFATNPQNPNRDRPPEEVVREYTRGLTLPGHNPRNTLMNPDLIDRLRKEADSMGRRSLLPTQITGKVDTLGEKVALILEKSAEKGLDGILMVNQLAAESTANLNERAVGPPTRYGRAKGMGQFIASTGAEYGLHTDADFFDAEKSIDASTSYMSDLTKRFGDQRLAAIAYNAGQRTVEKFGPGAKFKSIMAAWERQRETEGVGDFSKPRHQTYDYLRAIVSDLWSPDKRNLAEEKMAATGLIGAPDTGLASNEQPVPAGRS